jgi:hypothetical protein
LYRAALYLCPPEFRREFSDEIVRVFDEARGELASAPGGESLWTFRARMTVDLVATIVRQWMRTGWPYIAVASVASPAIVIAFVTGVIKLAAARVPRVDGDNDVLVLALLSSTVVLLIAGTIILTLWFTRPLLYRRRR